MQKVIGMDLDGTITSLGLNNQKRSPPWWLWYFLALLLLLSGPKKSVIKKMRIMSAQGYKFIIITSRPKEGCRFTRFLLWLHRVPFDGLFCVGYGKGVNERKLEVIWKEMIGKFIDSDKQIVEFMKRNSVDAFTTLDEIFNQVEIEKEGING